MIVSKYFFGLDVCTKTLLKYSIPRRLFDQNISYCGTTLESLYAIFKKRWKQLNLLSAIGISSNMHFSLYSEQFFEDATKSILLFFFQTFPDLLASDEFLTESLKTGWANATNNFGTFFNLWVWTKFLLEYISLESSLIKVKVTLGIFYSNNIHISIGKENNTKMFSRGWGFSSTYFFLRFRVFLPVVLRIRIFILLCKPSTVNEQSAKVQFYSIMRNGIFFSFANRIHSS